jgi:2-oxoglutarate dehydrogenase complex dehydrogenase (E1) component-like enzyme
VASYPGAAELVWVQEEPANQGAWGFVALGLHEVLPGRALRKVSRKAASSPAVGTHKVHEREQRAIVETAFA